MIIKNKDQRKKIREAAQLSTDILEQLVGAIKPGIVPRKIDDLADSLCKKHQVKPSFRGVPGSKNKYEFATCISVNDVALHGIPDAKRKLVPGDIVKIDFGIIYQGLFTDHCVTVGIKHLEPEDKKLVEVTKQAVQSAVKLVKTGVTTGLLGSTMHKIAQDNGFDVLKQYVGHGIGKSLHDAPPIPAYGNPFGGSKLKQGMAICVEAQVVPGSDQVFTDSDGWSVKTVDGGKAAMFEYMVLVDKNGPEILTPTMDWPIIV